MTETSRIAPPVGDPSVSSDDPWLAPADASDPVLDAYRKDIDRTLLRENLKLTPEERAQKFLRIVKFADDLREAGRRARTADPRWGLK